MGKEAVLARAQKITVGVAKRILRKRATGMAVMLLDLPAAGPVIEALAPMLVYSVLAFGPTRHTQEAQRARKAVAAVCRSHMTIHRAIYIEAISEARAEIDELVGLDALLGGTP